jgi:signal transduction histidine kinase
MTASIRMRLNFVAFLAVIGTFVFAALAFEARDQERRSMRDLIESLDLRSAVQTSVENPFSHETARALQDWRALIDSESLAAKLSDAIQAYNARDRELFQKRATDFLAQERDRFKVLQLNAAIARDRTERMVIAALLIPMLGLFWTAIILRRRVFKSVDRLSRRMMDFLVDRYSFQFSEPETSEIGDLQKTFNSLAERVLNTMDELKTLDQAKSEFLSIASHELRTPMTSIKGSLSLLTSGVMGELDAGSLRLIRIAEGETDRLIRLINDLLDLAKIEAGRFPLVCSWAHWDELMTKTSEGLSGLALSAGVEIEWESASDLEIYLDRDRVQQVLANLISNAVKFSPRGSKIRIAVKRDRQSSVEIDVVDQGPGIAPEDQDLIFQKFRQGAKPENPLVKGTGLGLAIAKALVEEHGGVIGVRSEPGQGSTFTFSLPRWRDDNGSSPESAA